MYLPEQLVTAFLWPLSHLKDPFEGNLGFARKSREGGSHLPGNPGPSSKSPSRTRCRTSPAEVRREECRGPKETLGSL